MPLAVVPSRAALVDVVKESKVHAQAIGHAVVLDSPTERVVPTHHGVAVLVIDGAGRLSKNSGQRFILDGQADQTDVHLPHVEVGEDAAVPIELTTDLVPDTDVEPHDNRRGDDLEYGVG